MNHPYLLLQADYEGIVAAICSNGTVITSTFIPKMDACKSLMVAVSSLLESHSLKFTDIAYLAVNQGPAPFTTLRVVITTANALNFAHNIPLVGIDALQVLAQQCVDLGEPAVALLNAFSQDVYFSILDNGNVQTGWGNYKEVINQLAVQFQGCSVTLLGNGVDLYKDYISTSALDAHFLTPNPAYVDIAYVALSAHVQWSEQRNVTNLLEPLYLKTQEYKPSM